MDDEKKKSPRKGGPKPGPRGERKHGRPGGKPFAKRPDGGKPFAKRRDDAGEARRIAERLWSRAMEPFEVDGHFLHVGASIGFVLGDGTIDNAEAMIEAADRAMYAAKRAGRPMLYTVK